MASDDQKRGIVECIFKQYIFNAIILIVEATGKQLISKEENPIISLVEELGNGLKAPYTSWFEGMIARSSQELQIAWKQVAESDIDIMKNEKGEDLKTILSIAKYLIDTGLHDKILKAYSLNENIDLTVDFDTFSLTSNNLYEETHLESSQVDDQNDPPFEKETVPPNSPATEKETNESPPLIVKKPSPKRKREASAISLPPPKRVKQLSLIKAFLAFKFHPNPLVGVRNYTFVTFKEFVVNEPCLENWIDKLCAQLEHVNVTHLYVQGRLQARYLREHIPNIYVMWLPERNKEKVCDECKTYSCSVGKVKNYMKDFHNFTPPVSCK